MDITKFSYARDSLKAVFGRVAEYAADYTFIARRNAVGRPRGPAKGMSETDYLLSSPANAAHLRRSIAQYRAGKVEQHDLVDD